MRDSPRTRLVVLATGGTIAGLRDACSTQVGSTQVGTTQVGTTHGGGAHGGGTNRYTAGQVDVHALLKGLAVPAGMVVEAEQVAQVDSKDMTHALWQTLARRCAHHLARADVAGLVVTHGTDTMEETAVFLDRALAPQHQPVVLTGSMRPADAPDADGPGNLTQALAVAAVQGARGVVVAMAGQVHAARAVRKAHATRVSAFDSAGVAPLARWVNGCMEAASSPDAWPVADRVCAAALDLDPAQWPQVAIVVSHAGSDGGVVDALMAHQARQFHQPPQGLIVASTGNGTLHSALEAALERAKTSGVVVRRVTRCADGFIDDHDAHWPASAMPTAAKARVELMLDLMDRVYRAP